MHSSCFIVLSVLCTVDLTKQAALSLKIEKTGSDPYCEMSVNSTVTEKVVIAAGTKASLSFLDCPKEDMRLTASDVTGTVRRFQPKVIYINVQSLEKALIFWEARRRRHPSVSYVSSHVCRAILIISHMMNVKLSCWCF